jgi:hypothetical protein
MLKDLLTLSGWLDNPGRSLFSASVRFVLLIPLVLSHLNVDAQDNQSIRGKIVDSDQSPIVGAYIIHLKSDRHVHSNELGVFQLNEVAAGDTLEVHNLGFKNRYFVIGQMDKLVTIELETAFILLDEVVVGQSIKSTSLISDIDIQVNPVKSSQELLRIVPGLFTGQHAGGGKAEQIFLRGFDIDHGTDVSITVDDIPVNMVSHAHGQGYADLHFLIPETVDYIDYGKGPYYGDRGNFTTAGFVNLRTKDRLENSIIQMELGQFNTSRTLAILDVISSEKQNMYIAGEYLLTDGPFKASQHFNRLNLMSKMTSSIGEFDKITLLASHFQSKWDASGQIPLRAVESGLITRFGAIDSTEGGNTSRTNLGLTYLKSINQNAFFNNRLYYVLYDFALFSNFTFFDNDPVNGDQIRQQESRKLFGFESEFNYSLDQANFGVLLKAAFGFRYDDINGDELSRTLNRKTVIQNIQLGDVDEHNFYSYVTADLDVDRWLFQPSIRLDYFRFGYVDALQALYQNQSQGKMIVSPKLNTIFSVNPQVQLYLKGGIGFHSNDTRVVLNNEAQKILPRAYGSDLGVVFKPSRKLVADFALWYLDLEQEFVYVGDEGIVEPSGRSVRKGVDLALRYQPFEWLFLHGDFNYAHARSVEEDAGNQYIPLAPVFTSSGAVNFRKDGWSGGMRYRHIADRPATSDNSIVAAGYFVTDLYANYDWKRITIGLEIENLFDTEWKETQFATESRLSFEDSSFEEIHFTPGTPFFFTGKVAFKF